MVPQGLIIQADLLLSRKQLPAVSDLVTGFERVNPARSSIMPANDRTDPCHKER
jgi:hypothetical protein